MDPLDLARAILEGRMLAAREWVNESARLGVRFDLLAPPETDDHVLRVLCGGLVELLAQRRGQPAPGWASTTPGLDETVWLTRFARDHDDLARECRERGPEPLRRRNLMAMPQFLTSA